MKNKKRIKSVVNMLEAQNEFLRRYRESQLLCRYDTDDIDGRSKSSLETTKKQSDEPRDSTSVTLAKEEDVSDLFEDGL